MNIDLTKLITSSVDELEICEKVIIPKELLANSSIRELKNSSFSGKVIKLLDDSYQISGVLSGVMILPDDITLEDVEVSFESQVEEEFGEFVDSFENNLKIIQNTLDIRDFLWQNILVEIPTKVVHDKNKNLALEGNGWRLVTEEALRKCNNSPFGELSQMFDSRKE